MPCSRAAQFMGGKHPASDRQKQVAREWAIAHKPWLRSTGPKSLIGISISSSNSVTHGLHRQFTVLTPKQLDALQKSPDYKRFNKRMAELEARRERQAVADRERLRQILLPIILKRKKNYA